MGKALHVHANANENSASGFEGALFGSQHSATEALYQASWRQSGTFSLHGRNNYAGDGTNTVRIRIASANGNLVTSAAGTGWQMDSSNSDTISPPQLVNWAFTDTGTNASYGVVTVSFDADTNHVCYQGAADLGVVMDVASSTRFIHLSGDMLADADTSETNCQIRNKSASKLNSFQVQCSTNARVNTSTFKSRKNAADGNCSAAFGAGVTGLVIDSTNEDTLASDDLICASITLGTGVEDLGVNLIAAAFVTTSGHKNEVVGYHGVSRAASATEHFWALGGWIAVNTLTEAQVFLEPGFNGSISNLQGYISANTYTGSADLNARKNNADGLTVTIGAGVTGWVQNTSSFTFITTDDLNLSFVGGTSGNATVFHTIVTVTDTDAVIPFIPRIILY